jgi:hypothetical protein
LIFLFDKSLGECHLARFLIDELAEDFVLCGYNRYLGEKETQADLSWWMRGSDDAWVKFMNALEEAHKVDKNRNGVERSFCYYHDHNQTKPCTTDNWTKAMRAADL